MYQGRQCNKFRKYHEGNEMVTLTDLICRGTEHNWLGCARCLKNPRMSILSTCISLNKVDLWLAQRASRVSSPSKIRVKVLARALRFALVTTAVMQNGLKDMPIQLVVPFMTLCIFVPELC